ncbi:MAG TPA: PKD domain-containing protein [Candidatus Paceibacterota bacterium]|nr:PKD domain-containing protein [Candidatus Paceibacterota bacterium]
MADSRRALISSVAAGALGLLAAGFLSAEAPAANAHVSSSHCNPTAVCYNWPSPRVLITWGGGCTAMEKGGYTGNNPTPPYQPYVRSMHNPGLPYNYAGCGNYFCQPAGVPAGSYVDPYVTPGWTYGWRLKVSPVHASTTAQVFIDSCNCGGPCPPVDDAQFISSNFPATLAPGQPFVGTVTFRNAGTGNWTAGTGYRTATSAANATRWSMAGYVDVSGTVAPGVTQAFIFNGTAPLTAGYHSMDPWRMQHSGTPFGAQSPAQNILVNTNAQGQQEATECTGITGWAQDPDSPVSVLQVRIYRDGPMGGGGSLQATIAANGAHPSRPGHGFSWAPPQDATNHSWHLYAQDPQSSQWIQLAGSPDAVTCYAPPVVTFNAAPASVPFNGATTLTWSTANPTGTTCAASNGTGLWTTPAAKALNGNFDTGPLTTTTTYTLTCTNPGGSDAKDVIVIVGTPPAPAVVSVNTSQLPADYCQFGASVHVSWSSTAKPQSAYQVQIADEPTFTAPLYDSGKVPSFVALETDTPDRNDTLLRRIFSWLSDRFSFVQIAWARYGAGPDGGGTTSCFRDDQCEDNPCNPGDGLAWCKNRQCWCPAGQADPFCPDRCADRGLVCPSGSCYTVHVGGCRGIATGPIGGVLSYCAVDLIPPPPPPPPTPTPPPLVNISAVPPAVPFGNSSTINWGSALATTCTATQGTANWPGPKGLSGGHLSDPMGGSTQFVLSCSGPGGVTNASTTVTVGAPPPGLQTSDEAFVTLPGQYNANLYVRVKVWNDMDSESVWSAPSPFTTFTGPFPDPEIESVPATPAALTPATFNDIGTYTYPVTNWNWDMGDGAMYATGPSIMHTYAESGNLTVTLTVTDSEAHSCSVTKNYSVNQPIPQIREVRPQ